MQANEPLLPLVQAVENATGRRPHLSTVLRWCTRGVRGIQLESWMVGGRRLTSVQAVRRFVDAQTAAASPCKVPPVSHCRGGNAGHKAAMKRLAAEGL